MRSPDAPYVGVVEDDPIMGESIAHRLEMEGYKVEWWRSGRDALQMLRHRVPDLLICDIRLPDISGEDLFKKVIPDAPGTPFLFITGFAQIDQAVRLTQAGAADYLAKPFAMPGFLCKVQELTSRRSAGNGVLGRSAAMQRIEDILRRVANVDSTILLCGESGVGKEVAARFLHAASDRAKGPFIAVNCAAIPDTLMESELFGHERGAFTGANNRHSGYVERARGGILFLDEIGELPSQLQPKLLRFLESRHFYRVGGEIELLSDARIVCATNSDLQAAVARGGFRQDLLFRIQVIKAEIPPLRDRRDDIEPLMGVFRAQFSTAFNRHIAGFTPDAVRAAIVHEWPGNVRELRNRVERAIALSETPWIGIEHMFPEHPIDVFPTEAFSSLASVRDQVERQHIRAALQKAKGNVEGAAELLGISRSTLFDRLKKLKIAH